MTNYEYIKSLSKDDLGEMLCVFIWSCSECPMRYKCRPKSTNSGVSGFQKWLEEEHEDNKWI